jgi:hypothetical protein
LGRKIARFMREEYPRHPLGAKSNSGKGGKAGAFRTLRLA